MKHEDWVELSVIALLALCLFAALGLVAYATYQQSEDSRACEARGGRVLEARGMWACVDPRVFK